MKISLRRTLPVLALALSAFYPGAAQAQTTVFSDEFDTSFDTGKWEAYDSTHFLQRTQFGNAPVMVPKTQSSDGTGYARLFLNTYNPDRQYPTYVRGTEIVSREFTPGTGLEIEARVRGVNLPRGIVFAFFTIGQRGTWPTSYLKEEIDFEFLTNFPQDKLWLNIWDDWNPERGGLNQATQPVVPGLDRNVWNVYKIRWLNDRVEWIVNDVVVRTSTNILPDDPMQVRFNIWAAASGWSTAFDGSSAGVVAASSTSADKAYSMDVDYVRVKTVAPPARAFVGNGDGLAANYYDNVDFTVPKIARVEPRVKFDWGQHSPHPSIGVDSFSARWNGWLQPQFSQSYVLSATADDGVRVYLNNALIVDGWKNQAPTRYASAPIALTAGKLYPIRVEYYESTGGASVRLAWSHSGSTAPEQLIPQTQLYSVNRTATAPVTIVTPRHNASYRSLASASGTATDAGGGLTSVAVRLSRRTDEFYWNGSTWVAGAVEFPARGTTSWSFTLPALPDGRYRLRARTRNGANIAGTMIYADFIIDNTAPAIAITAPQPNATYASLASATGTSSDLISITGNWGRLYRYSDSKFWSGSQWQSQYVNLPASGTTAWKLTLPALAPGQYYYQAVAADSLGNKSYSSLVNFSISSTSTARTTQPSGSALSSSSASAAQSTIVLGFSTPLNAADASDAANYSVEVAGKVRPISGVLFQAAQNSVTLQLAPGALQAGEKVLVRWNGGRAADGRILPAETWTVIVR